MKANPLRRQPRLLLAVAMFIGLLIASTAPAAAVTRLDGSHESTLMPVPDAHPTLMPIPGGAKPATADTHDEPMADEHAAATESTDGHGGGHSGVAAPDAAGRRTVIAGFAFLNLFILGAAGTLRRFGKRGRRSSAGRTVPARSSRATRSPEGGTS